MHMLHSLAFYSYSDIFFLHPILSFTGKPSAQPTRPPSPIPSPFPTFRPTGQPSDQPSPPPTALSSVYLRAIAVEIFGDRAAVEASTNCSARRKQSAVDWFVNLENHPNDLDRGVYKVRA